VIGKLPLKLGDGSTTHGAATSHQHRRQRLTTTSSQQPDKQRQLSPATPCLTHGGTESGRRPVIVFQSLRHSYKYTSPEQPHTSPTRSTIRWTAGRESRRRVDTTKTTRNAGWWCRRRLSPVDNSNHSTAASDRRHHNVTTTRRHADGR